MRGEIARRELESYATAQDKLTAALESADPRLVLKAIQWITQARMNVPLEAQPTQLGLIGSTFESSIRTV